MPDGSLVSEPLAGLDRKLEIRRGRGGERRNLSYKNCHCGTCVLRKLSQNALVDAAEALERAQRAADRWLLYFTVHATERMQERLATHADVRHAVMTADLAVVSDDGPNRWVLCGGYDLDDCGLRVVVAIDGDTVTVAIVTVYPP